MFEEYFDDGTHYSRIEAEDFARLEGKRINGRGKIVGYTRAEGELHPSYVHLSNGDIMTAEQLQFAEIDGRHNVVEI